MARHNHSNPWKLYRNDPCECGSGIKHKFCCRPQRKRKLRLQTHKVRVQRRAAV